MSISKIAGHMRSIKLNFSATVLTFGLEGEKLKNILYGKAPPRGPNPRPIICHFYEVNLTVSYKLINFTLKIYSRDSVPISTVFH